MPGGLAATDISQYVRLGNCDRYLWFRLFPDRTKALLRQYGVTEQPLTPLLSELGGRFEEDVLSAFASRGLTLQDLAGEESGTTVARLKAARSRPVALAQAHLDGKLGKWDCYGRADLILARPTPNGLDTILADIKASREEKVDHRLQVAFYRRLLEQMLSDAGVAVKDISGAILHRNADGTLPDVTDELPTFDLGPYLTALDNLVAGEGAVVDRIAGTPFEDLPYHLNYKCDGCLYNALCMTESALRQDISLIPYLQPVEKRVLVSNGIRTLRDLVGLKEWPQGPPWPEVFPPAPGKKRLVTKLSAWPLGPVLDRLVVRARAVLHRYDESVDAVPYIPNAMKSELPAGDDLVRVYLDAQHDYLQDRVYLLGARVVGPKDEVSVVHLTPSAPTDEDEQSLFVRWTTDLTQAIRQCAGDDLAKVHFYVFDRYDQRVVLEGLKRHLGVIASIPAFYDLLTQTPALTQATVSFLADEVRERRALPWLNQSLVRVANALRFDWTDGELEFFRLFQARVFDDRRRIDAGPTIEVAARFNSQIPLEYAYGVWGLLPEPDDAWHRHLLAPFRRVTRDHLVRFAEHRLRALAHIEQKLRPRSSSSDTDKEPLRLDQLAQEGPATDLPQALVNFLFMEHHARVQELMQLYALPIGQRAHTGRALLLRCLREPSKVNDLTATFEIDFAGMGLDPTLGSEIVRFREGAWGVINPVIDEEGRPMLGRRLASGRLCLVKTLEANRITVQLRDFGRNESSFRFKHWKVPVTAGDMYTFDEMADDLLGDRLVQACQNARENLLIRLATSPDRVETPAYSQRGREAAVSLADLVSQLETPNSPTRAQAEIIGERLSEPVLLVQGPPGTGKSHTLGWTVLARLLALPESRRPRLVAVSSKTHNAVRIVLESIAQKHTLLQERAPLSPEAKALRGLKLVKLEDGDDAEAPSGCEVLSPYRDKSRLTALVDRDLTVIGATPGGLFNLVRHTRGGSWDTQLFDLAVIDEASQVSLPEAVLACAYLKPGAQVIVVGDHRQMPPIITHPWKDEPRREAEEFQPYRSVFEYLVSLDTPRVGLDESFRLHKVLAEFLAEHIYKQDGIPFFSRRVATLDPKDYPEPFLAAVLDPDYPVVIVEHEEHGSQQANPLEAALVAPIVKACSRKLKLDGRKGIGIVVPHRAQKALLSDRLSDLAAAGAIDTVERFQGGERDVIIVSATVSDPDYALAEAAFLMDARRLNVALSRPRKKLIVVGSDLLFRLLPADQEVFEQVSIWKVLRFLYSTDQLWAGEVEGVPVRVYGRGA
ncbi:MAG: DEAD/DEAH box helicase [Bacillota bacterium]|nr:DEAD/DEAH box helicase [Bacillota bacterium]